MWTVRNEGLECITQWRCWKTKVRFFFSLWLINPPPKKNKIKKINPNINPSHSPRIKTTKSKGPQRDCWGNLWCGWSTEWTRGGSKAKHNTQETNGSRIKQEVGSRHRTKLNMGELRLRGKAGNTEDIHRGNTINTTVTGSKPSRLKTQKVKT